LSNVLKAQPQQVSAPFDGGGVDGYTPSCPKSSRETKGSRSVDQMQMVADLEFSVLGKQQYMEMGQVDRQDLDGAEPDVLSAEDRAILREIRCFDEEEGDDEEDDDDEDANGGVVFSSFMKIYSIVLDWATPRASHYLQELRTAPQKCTLCTWNIRDKQSAPVTAGGIKRRKSIHHMLHVEGSSLNALLQSGRTNAFDGAMGNTAALVELLDMTDPFTQLSAAEWRILLLVLVVSAWPTPHPLHPGNLSYEAALAAAADEIHACGSPTQDLVDFLNMHGVDIAQFHSLCRVLFQSAG